MVEPGARAAGCQTHSDGRAPGCLTGYFTIYTHYFRLEPCLLVEPVGARIVRVVPWLCDITPLFELRQTLPFLLATDMPYLQIIGIDELKNCRAPGPMNIRHHV